MSRRRSPDARRGCWAGRQPQGFFPTVVIGPDRVGTNCECCFAPCHRHQAAFPRAIGQEHEEVPRLPPATIGILSSR